MGCAHITFISDIKTTISDNFPVITTSRQVFADHYSYSLGQAFTDNNPPAIVPPDITPGKIFLQKSLGVTMRSSLGEYSNARNNCSGAVVLGIVVKMSSVYKQYLMTFFVRRRQVIILSWSNSGMSDIVYHVSLCRSIILWFICGLRMSSLKRYF